MSKIVYTNSIGKSIELGNSFPFVLSSIEGTGSPEVKIQVSKAPYQDGSTVDDVLINERIIPINGTMKGDSIKDLYAKRQYLCSIFNPKLKQGKLKYINDNGEKIISCYAEQSPVFGEMYGTAQEFLITLFCANPFWMDTDYILEEIIIWIGGAKFPCKFPISFAIKGSTRKNIINVGDVETPVEVTFKGPISNPCITNLTTKKHIKINRVLTADDTLIINTEFGNKRVEIVNKLGNKINAFNYIDLDSTFFNLQVGDNIIQYSSDNGVEPASVSVKYNNRYVGV